MSVTSSHPDDAHERASLLAELDWPVHLIPDQVAACTTAQLRQAVDAKREELGFYVAAGLTDPAP